MYSLTLFTFYERHTPLFIADSYTNANNTKIVVKMFFIEFVLR